MTFGQFIKQKRIEAKLTLKQMAKALDYKSISMVSMLENNERYWQVNHIVKLAKLFDVQPWELIKEWIEN